MCGFVDISLPRMTSLFAMPACLPLCFVFFLTPTGICKVQTWQVLCQRWPSLFLFAGHRSQVFSCARKGGHARRIACRFTGRHLRRPMWRICARRSGMPQTLPCSIQGSAQTRMPAAGHAISILDRVGSMHLNCEFNAGPFQKPHCI